MSTQSTLPIPIAPEVKCPDCGTTLSRKYDLKRHRKTQHPTGTEVKYGPLSVYRLSVQDRSEEQLEDSHQRQTVRRFNVFGFTDPAARIRHRKKAHGYQPYHTPRYLAKKALREAERKRGKAALNNYQQAASVVPNSSQNASSSADTLGNVLSNATYHNDFWKLLVDAPSRDTSGLKVSQDVQIRVPVTTEPARNTPKTLHSDYDLLLPKVGEQPSIIPKRKETYVIGSQLDTIAQPQSQASAQLWSAYGPTIPGVASDHRPFAPTFPTSGWQSTYPDFQSLPAFSFTNVPSSMPDSFNIPSTSTASSSRISGNQFVYSNLMAGLPALEPLPALSWTPSSSLANSTPVSQTEFFTGEPNTGFNTWCQSHNFS
ncbi:hypothetical protein EI94DRAFT_1796796 [Lactarius quietus]|nr:hypothetical protein EI94DRAFT_1796796 [Lactarius quietus]